METTYNLHAEEDPTVKATAEVRSMGEGDLLIGVRSEGAHPDDEKAIVLVAIEADGSYSVTVLDGGGCLLGKVEVAA